MPATIPELRLSEPYRLALRAFAALLEARIESARRAAFAARRALTRLPAHERGALARWLTWQTVTATMHGNLFALTRIHRTDVALGREVEAMTARLPSLPLALPAIVQALRHSA